MLLVGTMFVAMVAYLPGVVSVTFAGRWAVLLLGTAVMLLTMRKRPLLGVAHFWALLLFLWAVSSWFWSASPFDTGGELLHWLALGLLFLAASQYSGDPTDILIALALGVCCSIPFVVLQLQGGVPVTADDVPAGLFLGKNAMGEVAAVIFVWALARRQWVFLAPLLFLVLASTSRGALLAVMVGMLFDRRLRFLTLGVGCIFAYTMFARGWEWGMAPRIEIWETTFRHLTLLGYGLNTYGELFSGYGYGHNDILQLVFELGIGACLAIPIGIRALGRKTPETTALIALASAALVSFPLHHPMGAALMAVLSGYCCGASDRERRSGSILRATYFLSVERWRRGNSAGNLQHTR